MLSWLISEWKSYPYVIYHRLLVDAERSEEFGAAQHKPITLIACGVIDLDTHVKTKDKKSKVKPESESRSDAELLVELIPLELRISISNGLYVDTLYPRLEGPGIAGIQEYSAVDKSEKFLAKCGAGLDENICRFFQAVVEQAVGFRTGTEVGFEG